MIFRKKVTEDAVRKIKEYSLQKYGFRKRKNAVKKDDKNNRKKDAKKRSLENNGKKDAKKRKL